LELEQSVPTVDELTQLRSTRDQGWQLVLRAWREHLEGTQDVDEFVKMFSPLQNLADAYARSVQDADQVADRLRNDADRVAMKAAWQADRDQRSRRSISLDQELQEAEARLNDLDSQWNALWHPVDVTPSTPAEMREWLRQQQDIAQIAERIRTTRPQVRRMQERLGCMQSDLRSMLIAAGVTVNDNDSLHSLLSQATQHIENIQNAIQQRDQLLNSIDTNREDLEEAESRFTQAEHELTQWQSDWSQEMSRLGLEGDAIPSQANRVLTDINELFKEYQQADQYRTRLQGIARESREFQTDVRELAERLVPDSVELPTADIVNLLVAHLQEARSAKQEHDSLTQQVVSLQIKSRRANEAISDVKAQLDEMCRQAACQAYEQLSDAARRSNERVAWETTVRDLEDQLIKQGSGTKLDDLIAEAEAEIDHIDSIDPRIEELEREIEQTNAERDEVVRQIEREKAELRRVDGGGDAAEKAVACEGIAANLEEQIEQLAVLRMAAAMLHAAIERHRDKNQGPVLSRASDLFSQITQNRFQRLQAEFNERGDPILTGVRSDGQEVVDVAGMSDGTCDQLYLALRLASLETWLQHHEPLPFIVDDVLLNFDDERAIATLKTLGDLSTQTQVIFFTHHRHLVDIAEQHLAKDQLFVHELSGG
jgi:uncharacterized protein YhaN